MYGLHVIGNHRYPIIFLKRVGESVARIQRVPHEVIIGRGKLDQKNSSDGRFRLGEVGDGLCRAVFGDAEVALLEPGDKLPVLGRDQNIHIDQGHVHFD